MAVQNPITLTDRFWSKVEKTDTCWLWAGQRNKKGYGRFQLDHSASALAHRLSWMSLFGQIPDGLCVLHHCDVPACVNAAHLWLGTRADNNNDAARKGRQPRPSGERNSRSKLTDDAVRDIRARRIRRETIRSISIIYGVGESAIKNAATGRRWRHVV